MKVQEIMSGAVHSCGPETNVAAAATMMWDGDCGVIPVIQDNQTVGMITDRDICIAVATRNHRAEEIKVGDVIGHELLACGPDDDVRTALHTMRAHKVRRLPVVGKAGELLGVLSLNDIVLEAKESKGRKASAPSYEEIIDTFKVICGHRFAAVAA